MKKLIKGFITSALILFPAIIFAQTTVMLSPDKDNTIYSEGVLSNGNGIYIFTGNTGGSDTRRALLNFDISAIVPAGATITAVSLSLNMSKTSGGAESVALHKVTADWGEAGSNATGQEGQGAAAQAGDATWASAFHGTTAWTSAGGDFDASASATQTINQNGSYTWATTANSVSDVQAWLDTPATNFGWIIVGNEGGSGTSKRFDSVQNGTPANRPSLSVTYTTGLPVTLTDFSVIQDGKTALLSWSTATEINNSGFEIEFKTADKNWHSAGWIDGTGTTNQAKRWQHSVDLTNSGEHKFRLKQVDFDGTFLYSETILMNVLFDESLVLSNLYPNPANLQVHFSFNGLSDLPNKVVIFNLLGQIVYDRSLFVGDLDRALVVETKNWPAGVYFIQITENRSRKTHQFVVAH